MLLLLLLLESALAPYSQRNKALKLYYHIAEQWALCINSHKYHVGRSVTICQNTSADVLCIIWTSKRKSKRDGQHCNMFYCVQANAWSYLVSVVIHTTSPLLENVLSNGLSLCHSPLLQQHIFIVASPPSTTNNTRCLCVVCISSCFESMFGTTTFSYRVSQCEWIERAYLFA